VDRLSTGEDRIAAVASLDQPLRRRLYDLLAAQPGWMTRDQAAAGLGVPRSVVAFHLDKLAESGVVAVGFERTTGRAGPGAGRPAKRYRLAADEVSASVPDRRYDLAGQVMAGAIAEATGRGEPIDRALRRVARNTGRHAGAEELASGLHDDGGPWSALVEVLRRGGYEPVLEPDGDVALANCPFHRLAEGHRDLVCGMNLDYLTGLLDGLEATPAVEAHLAPEPGRCCVRLRPAAPTP
jgi:predicted ArsR family transcriptional regulator